jgi:energy-coupling factor transporter ATP-binding protein EcfA2
MATEIKSKVSPEAAVAAPEVEIPAKKFVLPTAPVKAVRQSPKNLIIFSKPKVGKTSLLAALPNCLILDLESGSDYLDALKIKASSIDDIREIGREIKAAGCPYTFIALDTITALEDMCVPYAEQLYAATPMGKTWFTEGKLKYGSLLNMPNGAGYPWLRQAFTKVVDFVKTLAPHVILVGHIKDTLLEKNGAEFTAMDLDLTGKLKRISSSNSDAIGYLYRKGDQNILSFKTTDEVACGARPEHLRNKEIVISEMTEEGLKTHWEEIYVELSK